MATANTALNRPRGPSLIPPQAPPPNHTHATFCAPPFIRELNVFEALMCFFTICPNINRGAQNVACVGGCVVVPGGVWGGISAGPRGLFSVVLAVAIVLMMVC